MSDQSFTLPTDLYFVIAVGYEQEIRGISKLDAVDQMIRHGEATEQFRILHIALDVTTNIPEAANDITQDMVREYMAGMFYISDIPTWARDMHEGYFNELIQERAA